MTMITAMLSSQELIIRNQLKQPRVHSMEQMTLALLVSAQQVIQPGVLFKICFLLFAVLYIVSYFIITRYKRKADEQEDEDAIVNRISLFLSTFTLAVSAGAVLLLPFSIISNEILLSFPQNYYIQWLNGSLIH
ncbi:hypothetical protein EK904_008061, partial [Melospiza melodia maxima]